MVNNVWMRPGGLRAVRVYNDCSIMLRLFILDAIWRARIETRSVEHDPVDRPYRLMTTHFKFYEF